MQRYREFERLRAVVCAEAAGEALTAREIRRLIAEHAPDLEERLDSPHRIATILGHHAEAGEVEVIRSSPYRYRLSAPE